MHATGTIQGSQTYDFGNGVNTAGTYAGGNNLVIVEYSIPSWWSKNKLYVFLGFGGTVIIGGACICIPCVINGVGTLSMLVVPIINHITKSGSDETTQSLVLNQE